MAPIDHPSPSPSHIRSISAIDTSYNGSGGLIEDNNIDLARDGYDSDILLPSPSKAVLPRQALSARLMSTISNAQSPAALNRSRSIIHDRAKSFAQLVPKMTSGTPTLGEHSGRESSAPPPASSKNQFLNTLFAGESAPVRLGVASSPVKEEPEPFMPEYKTTFTERPHARRIDSGRATNEGMRKSSWFARKFTPMAAASTASLSKMPRNDELASLDIHSSLFPHGPADPHDPHAFNDLLLSATSLLEKMQVAYREKSEYLASVQPEIDAQKEEVEEAETRSRHLKMQLEDMCTKAAEQDKAMKDLASQLAEEKMKLQDEKDRATRSLRMVPKSCDETDFATTAERHSRKRNSAGSTSDSGFESDYAESIVSGGVETPGSVHHRGIAQWQQGVPGRPDPRPVLSRQNTIVSVVSTASGDSSGHRMGRDAAAWTTVDQLRRENRDLTKQLTEMQFALQGCIDLVGNSSM